MFYITFVQIASWKGKCCLTNGKIQLSLKRLGFLSILKWKIWADFNLQMEMVSMVVELGLDFG